MTATADAARAAARRRWAPVAAGVAVAAVAFATVSLADGDEAPPPRTAPATATAGSSPSLGRTMFARMACGSCHHLAAAGTSNDFEIGPDLDTALASHTRASLRAQILGPDDAGSIGAMPSFAGRMSAGELDALVRFLLRSRPQR